MRAYLAGATLGASVPEVLLSETGAGALQIDGPRHSVRLELKADTGDGYWVVTKAPFAVAEQAEVLDEGAFRLHLNGQIDWSGRAGALEMDGLAEALATLVIG